MSWMFIDNSVGELLLIMRLQNSIGHSNKHKCRFPLASALATNLTSVSQSYSVNGIGLTARINIAGMATSGNKALILAAYLRSMTRIRSAQSRSPSVILLLLLSLVPADLTDSLGAPLKIVSAVGLLLRFLPQTKSTLRGCGMGWGWSGELLILLAGIPQA